MSARDVIPSPFRSTRYVWRTRHLAAIRRARLMIALAAPAGAALAFAISRLVTP